MVCVVRVLMSYPVCHRVVLLVHCFFLLYNVDLPGLLQNVLVSYMLTTVPCFVEKRILVIGHLWQHH